MYGVVIALIIITAPQGKEIDGNDRAIEAWAIVCLFAPWGTLTRW